MTTASHTTSIPCVVISRRWYRKTLYIRWILTVARVTWHDDSRTRFFVPLRSTHPFIYFPHWSFEYIELQVRVRFFAFPIPSFDPVPFSVVSWVSFIFVSVSCGICGPVMSPRVFSWDVRCVVRPYFWRNRNVDSILLCTSHRWPCSPCGDESVLVRVCTFQDSKFSSTPYPSSP